MMTFRRTCEATTLLLGIALASCSSGGTGDSGPHDTGPGDADVEAADADADADEDGPADADGPGSPCEPNPCDEPHRTRCVVLDEGHACECDPGFHEDPSGQCAADEGCLETTCSGHGTCSEVDGEVRCDCETGYTGEHCEGCDGEAGYIDVGGECTNTPCVPNPCVEEGRTRCTFEDGRVRCDCDPGSHDEGGECVADRTCLPDTCGGHGTCTEVEGGVRCECDPGYAGPYCELCDEATGHHPDGVGGCTSDPCVPSPCDEPHRSVCVATADGFRCDCDEGHHFDGGACVADERCEASSCSGHGACAVEAGRVTCDCDPGYLEPDCAACDLAAGYHDDGAGGCTNDPCAPVNPCEAPNQSVCVADAVTGYRCECDASYHDDGVGGCTDDPCVPNPCAPERACRDDGAGAPECYTPVCDDHEPCTTDRAVGAACEHDPLPDGSDCSTSICLAGEECTDGVCGGGVAVVCDDHNPCTDDLCEDPTGCESVADDENVPDDGIACTVDSCSGGVPSNVPDHRSCDDGRWCTGTESCAPADPAADADGCIATGVPAPPGRDTPCGVWVCDDSTHAFELVLDAPGTPCNDGIPCTSGDTCDAAGVCRGTLTAACGSSGGECLALGDLSTTLDVPSAAIAGEITLDGGPLPASSPSSGGLSFYLVAHDTGVRHRIASVGFGGCCGDYDRAAGSEHYDSLVMPGVYDVLYVRNYDSSYGYVYDSAAGDAFVNGSRLLARDVIVPAGSTTLDLDVPSATISGEITLDGGPLPASSPSSGGLSFYLVSQDTGVRHRIASVGFGGCCGDYNRAAGSEHYDSLVMPGVYDVLYVRNYDSSYGYVYDSTAGDEFVNASRMLQEGVVIPAGASTLDLDVPSATISGEITLDGGPLPMSSPSSGGLSFYLVSQDTGVRHRIASVGFGGCCGNYDRAAGSEHYDSLVMPGVYDVLYVRNYDSSYGYVFDSTAGDEFVNASRVLQEDIVIPAGATTLDLDVPSATISGEITLDGGPLPASSPSSGGLSFYLVSRDTGVRHRIASVGFGGCCGDYNRAAGSEHYDSLVMPGVYDVLYVRNYDSSYGYVFDSTAGDEFVNASRMLQEGVVIPAGASTLDLDVPSATISGEITLDGGPLPMSSPSSGGLSFYLVSQDTGVRHRIASVGFGGCCGNYDRAAGSEHYDSLVMPGVYDVLYVRNYDSSYGYVFDSTAGDEFVNASRVLQEDIVIPAGATTLDLDVPSATISGEITLDGGPLPASSPSSGGLSFYLRSQDTSVRHRIASVGFGGCCGDYDRAAGSEHYDSLVMPGIYDVLYVRNYDSSYGYVYDSLAGDAFVNASRELQSCVIVP